MANKTHGCPGCQVGLVDTTTVLPMCVTAASFFCTVLSKFYIIFSITVDVDGTQLDVEATFCYLGDMFLAGGGCDHAIGGSRHQKSWEAKEDVVRMCEK